MIFITAKFEVRPESVEDWETISGPFTEATRAEPGCLWFDWSRSLQTPHEFVLVEAFADDDAAAYTTSGRSTSWRRAATCRPTWPPRRASSTRPCPDRTGPSSASSPWTEAA